VDRTSSVEGEVTSSYWITTRMQQKAPLDDNVEAIAVAERYSWPESQLRIDDARFMPGLRRLSKSST